MTEPKKRRKCSSYCYTDVATLALYKLSGKFDTKEPLFGEQVKWVSIKSFWLDSGTYHAFSVCWKNSHCWKICHEDHLDTELSELVGNPEVIEYTNFELGEGWYGVNEDIDLLRTEKIFDQGSEQREQGITDYTLPKPSPQQSVMFAFNTGADGNYRYFVHNNCLTFKGSELSSVPSFQKLENERFRALKEAKVGDNGREKLPDTLNQYLKTQKLDEDFWTLWKSLKPEIKELGYSVSKNNGVFTLEKSER